MQRKMEGVSARVVRDVNWPPSDGGGSGGDGEKDMSSNRDQLESQIREAKVHLPEMSVPGDGSSRMQGSVELAAEQKREKRARGGRAVGSSVV
jgi:hypothetical protein